VRGLLYAGTERGVFASFDDGAHWRSLQRNLPRSSVRDLIVKDADLVVATHGRSFWILDGVTPLRHAAEATSAQGAYLFPPAPAWRVRDDRWTDTPLPPDEPAGENPPDGAVIDYRVPAGNTGSVRLQITDETGAVVRILDSSDAPEDKGSDLDIPDYWIRDHQPLAATPGLHRFVWDLHGTPMPGAKRYPIGATPHDTPAGPRGPWVLPGRYELQLAMGRQKVTRTLEVRADPRVQTPMKDQRESHTMALALSDEAHRLVAFRESLEQTLAVAKQQGGDAARIAELQSLLGIPSAPRAPGAPAPLEIGRLSEQVMRLYETLEGSDRGPTEAMRATMRALTEQVLEVQKRVGARGIPILTR
jgi:hypothetical protein